MRKLFEFRKSPSGDARDAAGGAAVGATFTNASSRGAGTPDRAARRPMPDPSAAKSFFAIGRDIDPLRLVVWSLFGILLLAMWGGIAWAIWALIT